VEPEIVAARLRRSRHAVNGLPAADVAVVDIVLVVDVVGGDRDTRGAGDEAAGEAGAGRDGGGNREDQVRVVEHAG
jgi:hypothetical protein